MRRSMRPSAQRIRHSVCVRRPERIERRGGVRRVRCAKVVRLRAAVARRPSRLRVACARERRAPQRQRHVLRLRRRLLRTRPVHTGLVGDGVGGHGNSRPVCGQRNRTARRCRQVLEVDVASRAVDTFRGGTGQRGGRRGCSAPLRRGRVQPARHRPARKRAAAPARRGNVERSIIGGGGGMRRSVRSAIKRIRHSISVRRPERIERQRSIRRVRR